MLRLKKIGKIIAISAFLAASPAMVNAQQLPAPQQQQEKIDVSDEELSKFAQAYQGIMVVNQEAQQKMLATVEAEGFDVKRFNEIHQASLDPETEVEVTPEEEEKHRKAIEKIQGMQENFQAQMEQVIETQGLSLERYEQVAMALQTDTELQQRLQQMLQG
ncbi:DUF4168 domain-containing protein [Salegentibacter sp. HM20]